MNKNYKYGFNLEEDLKQLYGDNYEYINDKRIKLFKKLEDTEPLKIQQLKRIIQNPIPITNAELKEWKNIKNEILKKYSIKYTTIEILNSIEAFVIKYHIVSD